MKRIDIMAYIYIALAAITPVKYLNKWIRIWESDGPYSKIDVFKWNIADYVDAEREGLTY